MSNFMTDGNIAGVIQRMEALGLTVTITMDGVEKLLPVATLIKVLWELVPTTEEVRSLEWARDQLSLCPGDDLEIALRLIDRLVDDWGS